MKNLFFALAITLFGTSAIAQNTDALLGKYIAVKDALITGNSKTVSQELAEFHQAIKDETAFEQKADLLRATEAMLKGATIEKQRAAFNNVSTTMWKLVDTERKDAAPVYYQYCPMKKAYWISNEKEIKNPYYGAAMLNCGSVEEIK